MPKINDKKSQNKKSQSSSTPATQKKDEKVKTVIFTLIMFVLPILFFIGAEFVLTLFNYGGETKLVLENESDRRFYRLNYEIGKVYFPKYKVTTAISYDVFLKEKPSNAYRIFVLGGSSAAGYPYMHNGAFSRMLRTRLEAQFPDKIIEVVNAAMPAVNTFTVLDFVKQFVRYKPDAFLLYTGHNEFYGALGVGSTETLGESRNVIKLYLFLQRYRTARLLRDVIVKTRDLFISADPDSKKESGTLMERMVRHKDIAYQSEEYQRALQFFKENLIDVINISKKYNIDILIGDLVANNRDQKPFVSIHKNQSQKKKWINIVENGFSDQNKELYRKALDAYYQAKKVDPEPALLYYLIGQCYEALNQADSAKVNYYRAKDRDGLRFRASEDFNEVLRSVCDKCSVPLVPIVQEFEKASPNGLVGDNLMTDHLHPNLQGFSLIARLFFQTMKNQKMISAEWKPDIALADSVLENLYGITEIDMLAAEHKIKILKGGWPFQKTNVINKALQFKPESFIEKMMWKWQHHEINWEMVHVQMADYYLKQGDLNKAAEEYQALIIGTPYNVSPYQHLAEIWIKQGQFNKALTVLQKSLLAEETVYANKWIGTIYLNKGRTTKALPFLEKANRQDPDDQQTMYNLSGAYFMSGYKQKAIATGDKLASINSNYPGLGAFLQGLKRSSKVANNNK